jgi:hypothetical protein
MPKLHNHDPQDLILDLIENTIVPLADPIPLLAREFLGTHGSRVIG